MLNEHTFIRDEVFPSWYANALGRYLSLGAFGFVLSKQDSTHIQVTAGADEDAAIIAIGGLWRFNESTVTRASPGGGAQTFAVYAVAKATNIVSTPAAYTDSTDYTFDLRIVTAGTTPTIVAGTVDVYRKVGSIDWDGSQITRVTQTVPALSPHAKTHATGGTDPLTPADIGAATAAALTAEITARQDADTSEAGARATADTSEATTRAAADTAESSARASADTAEQTARVAGDKFHFTHVMVLDDQNTPPQPAGSVVGHVPATILPGGAEGWSLVGVATRAIVSGGSTKSEYKVQTDHGSGTGVLANVTGLTSIIPDVGRYVRQAGTQTLSDLDTIAIVMVTPGTTRGIGVALEFERTHT